MVDGVFRLQRQQSDLIAASGGDFDPGAMWRAGGGDRAARRWGAASALVRELMGHADDEAY
ncbi:hypothetical protein [Streptomyces parvus]|uniref:hypothetical protein n=1 Tax=Streptomyces parvus TaxID=66428 RepID=UPI0035D7DED3